MSRVLPTTRASLQLDFNYKRRTTVRRASSALPKLSLLVYKPPETQKWRNRERGSHVRERGKAVSGSDSATSQTGAEPHRPAPSGKRERLCNCSADILERDHDTRTAGTPERRREFGTGSRVARPPRDARQIADRAAKDRLRGALHTLAELEHALGRPSERTRRRYNIRHLWATQSHFNAAESEQKISGDAIQSARRSPAPTDSLRSSNDEKCEWFESSKRTVRYQC